MLILGKQPTEFTPKDSTTPIKGLTLYLSEPLDPKRGGSGHKAERIFLSENKTAQLGFVPTVGMEISVSFNRWGKPDRLVLLNVPDDELEVE